MNIETADRIRKTLKKRVEAIALAAKFRSDVNVELSVLESRIAELKTLASRYEISLNEGSWRHSGDFGRIVESLHDVNDTLSWVALTDGVNL